MIYFFLCGTELGRQILCIHFDLPEIIAIFPEMSIRLYLFGILALTVIWVVVASIVGRHDVEYNVQQIQLEENTNDVRMLVKELTEMAEQHMTSDSEREWKKLIREAESIIPSEVVNERTRLLSKANRLLNIN